MNSKLLWLFVFCLVFTSFETNAQTNDKTNGPIYVGTPTKVEYVPSIASRSTLVRPQEAKEEMQDGRSRRSKFEAPPGKGSTGDDALAKNPGRLKNSIPTRMPSLVFETSNTTSAPTDPAGAVGPNHYFAVTNTAFQIFDKSGNSLTGGLVSPNPTIFPSGGCCDLTASYDNVADRWVLSMLGGGVQVAVSDGPDPVNDGWTVYTYGVVSDYQKLSVWHDGYYMTENTGSANKVHVFERDEMIAGNPAAQIVSFSLPQFDTPNPISFHAPQVFNLSHNATVTGPATVVWYSDDAWASVAEDDHFKLWEITMDWVTTANSTVSGPTNFGIDGGGTSDGTVTPFVGVFDNTSFSNLAQPGGGGSDLDALQSIVNNQAQFRKFGSYNSALFCFVVDVDGSATEQAGTRWYELRQSGDGQPWSIHQEGTYTAPDNRHAWNASMIMDGQGNIGMGYTSMSSANSVDPNVFAGSYYTGQMAASSGTGTMDVAEEVIMAGDAIMNSSVGQVERYGDYSKIDIDPEDDKKFWYVNELMQSGRKNIAAVFQLAPNTSDDVGVISIDTPMSGALSNSETVTVTVFNFGENSASGFDVTYQVDGGSIVSETFAGTLASGASAQHVFATPADLGTEGQTYTIEACTDYTGDEDTGNDCTSSDVTYVFTNDIGVTAITAPVSGEGLGNEVVSITIENFGTADQSGFDVNYIVDGGTPVVETVGANVPAGGSISYDFTQTANLSTVGTYAISSSTLLGTDSDNSNDTANTSVTNVSCETTNSTDTPITITDVGTPSISSTLTVANDFVIDDVNITVDIQHTWVGDLDITLTHPDGVTSVQLMPAGTCGNCDDINVTFDDAAGSSITTASGEPITGTFSPSPGSLSTFNGLMTAGDWTLDINDNADFDGGSLVSWSLQLCGNINLSVDDNDLNADLEIFHLGDGMYTIKLPTSSINERLDLTVLNMLGQKVYWKTLENESGSGYEHTLDMSYASSGVYLVRVGNATSATYKRIIVE